MRFVVVLIAYALGSIASFYGFIWGACLYLWSNIFRPLNFSYHPGALPVANYVAIVLLLSYLVGFYKGDIKPKMNNMVVIGGIFIGWLMLSSLFSPFQDLVWNEYFEILKYLIPLMLIFSSLNTFRDIVIITFTLMLSVGIWSAQAGIKGLLSGVTINMGIPGGQMTDNNDFMAVTVGILPLLIYFCFYYNWIYRKLVRFLLFITLTLSISAIVFSHSRGAALGLFGLVFAFIAIGSKKKVRDASVALAFLLCTTIIFPDTFWKRMGTINFSLSQQSEASAQNRMKLMVAAFNCAIDNPLFGVGPNSWLFISEKYAGERTEPHSIYIKIASEVGFPGLFIFSLLLFGTIYNLYKIMNRCRLKLDSHVMVCYANFSLAINLSIIGISISFAFLNHPYSEFLWAILGVANVFISLEHFQYND